MLLGSMFFLFGTRLFGRSTAFGPLVILALVILFSAYDGGQGLRRIFLGSWYGIPVILLIAAGGGLVYWLERRMEQSTREELSEEIAENEAAFTAANRPGGWKEYYGVGEDAAAGKAEIPEVIRKHGWRPSYSEASDRLADVAEAHRSERQRLLRDSDARRWMQDRSSAGKSERTP